jgi:hypothetical protein
LTNNLNQTFLADESCDFAIIRALRAEGFDALRFSLAFYQPMNYQNDSL